LNLCHQTGFPPEFDLVKTGAEMIGKTQE